MILDFRIFRPISRNNSPIQPMSSKKKKATTAAASKQTKGRGKKRAAVDDEEEEEDGTSASTALSVNSQLSSSSSSSSSIEDAADAARLKRLKSMTSDMSKHLVCSITQELPVDPVLAEDGHTYERAAIIQWIATKRTSPIDDNCRLDASRLMSNISVKQQIEALVESGELDDELCADFLERKYKTSPEYAQELYDEGKRWGFRKRRGRWRTGATLAVMVWRRTLRSAWSGRRRRLREGIRMGSSGLDTPIM